MGRQGWAWKASRRCDEDLRPVRLSQEEGPLVTKEIRRAGADQGLHVTAESESEGYFRDQKLFY